MNYALSAAYEVLQPFHAAPDVSQQIVAAKCLGLLNGYHDRWHDAPYRIDDVEAVLQSDLYNPETLRKSRSFTVAGKLDIRATEIASGAKVIIDHKTSSEDIRDFAAPFWKILAIEGQVSHYMMLEWLNENKVDKAMWDVMRKPGISPKGLAKKDAALVLETGAYFDFELDSIEEERFEAGKDDEGKFRETPMMYAARLSSDCAKERPDWYFQRRAVPRLDSEIHQYGIELWGHGQDILATRQTGRWPRNSGACFVYNSPCTYLGLCSGDDNLESGKWTTRAWVHPELPILGDGRGTDVLTNSRVRTFQTCRQKHYLKYELGVEKIDEEEREALFFGTMMHNALEQYFLALKKEQTNFVTG